MPYIIRKLRGPVLKAGASNVGELTYVLTKTVLDYLARIPNPPRYRDYAEVLGALESTKLELYRRVVGPYEDKKCEENGDVY
jgi:hypothetical protein